MKIERKYLILLTVYILIIRNRLFAKRKTAQNLNIWNLFSIAGFQISQ